MQDSSAPRNPEPVHILMVEDDPDFIRYALTASSSFNVLVTSCQSVQEALACLKKEKFGGYIIDLQLPDGSGFDIIKKIREQGDLPIAVVTGVYHDDESFRRLEKEYKVNYILDKPLYRDRIERLFEAFSGISPPQKAPVEKSRQDKLREYYQGTISDKIALLSKLIEAIHHQRDELSMENLKNAVHKIGGTAGSYGYQGVTKICKALEYATKAKIEAKELPTKEWLAELDHFLQEVKYRFQFQDSEDATEISDTIADHGQRQILYVVDQSSTLLNLLEKEKERFNIYLILEQDPRKAMELLLTRDFNPRGVLLAQSFPGYELSGMQMIRKMREKEGALPTIFGLILDHDDFDERMTASKEGIQNLFIRPVSPHVIMEAFWKGIISTQLESFRVLVLDDDEDVRKFIASALSEIGIQTKGIGDPCALYPTLEEFMPHVLILDILLPRYDGLSLLKSLRVDPIYRDLVVIIVTHYTDVSVNEVAYAEHALDVMYKPLNKGFLQKHLLEVSRQLTASGTFHPLQNRIGLASLQPLSAKLHEILRGGDIEGRYFILFTIDCFDDLILEKGRSAANKFLIYIGNQLIKAENDRLLPYFLEPASFAILTGKEVYSEVEEKIKKILMVSRGETGANVTFSVAVIPLSSGFTDMKDLLFAAEKSLDQLRKSENPSPVKIELCTETGKQAGKKDVLLVDPDTDLQKIIKKALEHYDIEVKTFSTGEEFLESLDLYHESHFPSLIIAERRIPDMDGLELLTRVRNRFRRNIPFYFLTVFGADNDISEGLSHGAASYITKPFNLSLLVQQVLSTLFKKAKME